MKNFFDDLLNQQKDYVQELKDICTKIYNTIYNQGSDRYDSVAIHVTRGSVGPAKIEEGYTAVADDVEVFAVVRILDNWLVFLDPKDKMIKVSLPENEMQSFVRLVRQFADDTNTSKDIFEYLDNPTKYEFGWFDELFIVFKGDDVVGAVIEHKDNNLIVAANQRAFLAKEEDKDRIRKAVDLLKSNVENRFPQSNPLGDLLVRTMLDDILNKI